MNVAEVMAKAENSEGLTVEEIMVYQANVKPIHHVYGKYGTLAKRYLEDKGTLWIVQDIPALLHGVDRAAERLYDVMYDKLSKTERFKRTGNYSEDVRRIGEMQRLIDEEIRNEIIYTL